jgi:hypothetical protein
MNFTGVQADQAEAEANVKHHDDFVYNMNYFWWNGLSA